MPEGGQFDDTAEWLHAFFVNEKDVVKDTVITALLSDRTQLFVVPSVFFDYPARVVSVEAMIPFTVFSRHMIVPETAPARNAGARRGAGELEEWEVAWAKRRRLPPPHHGGGHAHGGPDHAPGGAAAAPPPLDGAVAEAFRDERRRTQGSGLATFARVRFLRISTRPSWVPRGRMSTGDWLGTPSRARRVAGRLCSSASCSPSRRACVFPGKSTASNTRWYWQPPGARECNIFIRGGEPTRTGRAQFLRM